MDIASSHSICKDKINEGVSPSHVKRTSQGRPKVVKKEGSVIKENKQHDLLKKIPQKKIEKMSQDQKIGIRKSLRIVKKTMNPSCERLNNDNLILLPAKSLMEMQHIEYIENVPFYKSLFNRSGIRQVDDHTIVNLRQDESLIENLFLEITIGVPFNMVDSGNFTACDIKEIKAKGIHFNDKSTSHKCHFDLSLNKKEHVVLNFPSDDNYQSVLYELFRNIYQLIIVFVRESRNNNNIVQFNVFEKQYPMIETKINFNISDMNAYLKSGASPKEFAYYLRDSFAPFMMLGILMTYGSIKDIVSNNQLGSMDPQDLTSYITKTMTKYLNTLLVLPNEKKKKRTLMDSHNQKRKIKNIKRESSCETDDSDIKENFLIKLRLGQKTIELLKNVLTDKNDIIQIDDCLVLLNLLNLPNISNIQFDSSFSEGDKLSVLTELDFIWNTYYVPMTFTFNNLSKLNIESQSRRDAISLLKEKTIERKNVLILWPPKNV